MLKNKYILLIMNGITCLSLILLTGSLTAQKNLHDKGLLSLGTRSTISMFDEDGGGANNPGIGAGGQIRLQLNKNLNTEWFADFFKTPVGSLAYRNTAHIGWSVMIYPFVKAPEEIQLVKPYFLIGHCFDFANYRAQDNSTHANRVSSAIQSGIGTHFNISPRFDISLATQYMIHLGRHVHVEEANGIVTFEKEHTHGGSLEGHLLTTLSINYKIANLW